MSSRSQDARQGASNRYQPQAAQHQNNRQDRLRVANAEKDGSTRAAIAALVFVVISALLTIPFILPG